MGIRKSTLRTLSDLGIEPDQFRDVKAFSDEFRMCANPGGHMINLSWEHAAKLWLHYGGNAAEAGGAYRNLTSQWTKENGSGSCRHQRVVEVLLHRDPNVEYALS